MGRVNLEKLWRRDPRCQFCQRETVLAQSGVDTPRGGMPEMATEEHIIPRCLGGAELGPSNVVLACSKCNSEWLSLVDQWAARVGGVLA